jgi:hypothetical protein
VQKNLRVIQERNGVVASVRSTDIFDPTMAGQDAASQRCDGYVALLKTIVPKQGFA